VTGPITAELFASLDLVVEEPQNWHFPWVGPEMLTEVEREQTTDTLLLGRRTYEVFAGSWPKRSGDVPLADQLNRMKKVVVSDTIGEKDAAWSPTRVLRPNGDLAGAIASLGEEYAGRLTVAGSISLVEQLLAAGLLAELRLIVHPVILGTGRRLFDGWTGGRVDLELAASTALGRGARLDVYRPASGA
jgi:dihydrofolate reductase